MLARRDRPTAFVAGTEALTPAVLGGLAAANLRIPDDASMFGFGDSAWEQAYRPPLSVVRFDYVGVGRALVENVIARIEGVRRVPPVPSFPSEFVDRGSCAPPPGARGRAPARRR
jgi:DNA-binding LacI/PurR family transcriptional regulator